MIYLALPLICIFAVELFYFLPVFEPIKNLADVSQKSLKVLSSSKISDHWKEKALQRYARDMAWYSIQVALWMLLVLVLIAALSFVVDFFITDDRTMLEYLATGQGILLATLISVLYIVLRKRFVQA